MLNHATNTTTTLQVKSNAGNVWHRETASTWPKHAGDKLPILLFKCFPLQPLHISAYWHFKCGGEDSNLSSSTNVAYSTLNTCIFLSAAKHSNYTHSRSVGIYSLYVFEEILNKSFYCDTSSIIAASLVLGPPEWCSYGIHANTAPHPPVLRPRPHQARWFGPSEPWQNLKASAGAWDTAKPKTMASKAGHPKHRSTITQ